MRNIRRIIVSTMIALILIACLWSGPAQAQEKNRFPFFRARPLPECKSFFISEFGYLYRISRNTGDIWYFGDRNFYFTGEVGWMRNLDRRSAVGATIYLGSDDDGSRMAIKPRYRYWLGKKSSLDFSAGLIFKSFWLYEKSPGFIGQIAYNFSEWASLTTQVDIVPYSDAFTFYEPDQDKTEICWYTGVRLCSYPGLAAVVIVPVSVLFYTLLKWDD